MRSNFIVSLVICTSIFTTNVHAVLIDQKFRTAYEVYKSRIQTRSYQKFRKEVLATASQDVQFLEMSAIKNSLLKAGMNPKEDPSFRELIEKEVERFLYRSSDLSQPILEQIADMIQLEELAGYSLSDIRYSVGFKLWTIAGIQGIQYIETHYKKELEILRGGGLLNIKLNGMYLEEGYGTNEVSNKTVRELTDEKTTLIFGSGQFIHKKNTKAYTVDIVDRDDPDMIADMNNAEHLSVLPSGRFDRVHAECIPGYNYLNKRFLTNAFRLLKSEGTLMINYFRYMEQAPYYLNYQTFLEKFGFKNIRIEACDFNKHDKHRIDPTALCVFATKP